MILQSGIFALVLAAQQSTVSPAGPALKCTRFDFVMRVQMPERGGMGEMENRRSMFPSEMRGQMWKAGASIRLEVKMGESRSRVQILTRSALYSLMSSTKRGTKKAVTRSMLHDMIEQGSPFALAIPCSIKTVWPNARKVGTETAHGVQCEVWVAQVAGGNTSTVRIWIPRGKKTMSPVKLEINTKVGRRGSPSGIGTSDQIRRTVELSKISNGQTLPAAAFDVPKDYKITAQRTTPPSLQR